MEQINIGCNINFNSPRKEWVNVVKYHERKQYGSLWFKQMLNQMEMKEDRESYPHSIFFFIGDNVVMEQDEKNERLWVDYYKIWSFFYSEFNYNWQEVRDLIRGMVEEHFKIGVFPPKLKALRLHFVVEEHFKIGVFPPTHSLSLKHHLVEDHFKTNINI